MEPSSAADSNRFRRLIDIGIALSAERDHRRLQERILLEAKEIAQADGGTLYLLDDADGLAFAIMRNDSLGIALGGTTGEPIPYPPLRLHEKDGSEKHDAVATHVALAGETSNIADAYEDADFDFSGAKAFDEKTGYRSRSFLTVPLKNKAGSVTGVLQLVNCKDAAGTIGAAAGDVIEIVEALASQAAVTLENQQLLRAQKELFDSFIQLIAKAIDAKSPYTAGHCQRVPILAELIARSACDETDGPYAGFSMSEDERYEFHLAAWMHDCGKIVTPEHVVDKATKLETVHDRIEEVLTRIEILKRDAELWALREGESPEALQAELQALDDDGDFLLEVNQGGEFLTDEKLERIRAIATRTWRAPDGTQQPLLSEEEVENLTIQRGTLTGAERQVINDHVSMTQELLNQLPFPPHLSRVPEIAGGHHEAPDGSGYPRGLAGEQLDVPTRILAIADIFEALTAADRPYKPPKPMSESLGIMARMAKTGHVDPNLFRLFLEKDLHLEYGREHLRPEQLDSVDVDALLSDL
jgi:HD-GYP domain-containing protein (c-di-GMP phosphodiesterase class II)